MSGSGDAADVVPRGASSKPTAGIMAMFLGGSTFFFGVLSVLLAMALASLAEVMPRDPLGNNEMFLAAAQSIERAGRLHVPAWIIGGAWLTVAGWFFRRGDAWAGSHIRLLSVGGCADGVLYSLHSYRAMLPALQPLFADQPLISRSLPAFMGLGLVGGAVSLVVPFVLLWWLARPAATT